MDKLDLFEFDFLMYDRKAITPNDQFFDPYLSGGNAILTAITSSILSDYVAADEYSEVAVNINVGTPSGTSPTLTITFIFLDPINMSTKILTLTLTATALTAAALVRFVIKDGVATVWINGSATNLGTVGPVPMAFRVGFTVGGTSPSWPVEATYELRR